MNLGTIPTYQLIRINNSTLKGYEIELLTDLERFYNEHGFYYNPYKNLFINYRYKKLGFSPIEFFTSERPNRIITEIENGSELPFTDEYLRDFYETDKEESNWNLFIERFLGNFSERLSFILFASLIPLGILLPHHYATFIISLLAHLSIGCYFYYNGLYEKYQGSFHVSSYWMKTGRNISNILQLISSILIIVFSQTVFQKWWFGLIVILLSWAVLSTLINKKIGRTYDQFAVIEMLHGD